jgi:uncharacterized GH25 family protein
MNRLFSLSAEYGSVLSLLIVGLSVPTRVIAHDSWLVAGKNVAAMNEPVRLAFITAEVFPISEQAAKPDRVAEWVVFQGGQQRKVEGYAVEKEELATNVKFDQPGVHVVGVAMQPSFIELPAKDFAEYLEDEKATAALAAHRRGPGDQPGREFYTKFAKTFVEVAGGAPQKGFNQRVGHRLEIIPLSNPCGWKVGDNVKVRVLRDGQPVSGLRISSGHEGLDKHTYVEHATTDIDGAARFKLSRPGLWFFRTHTIQTIREQPAYAPPDAPKADWESFWASITFRVVEKNP